MKKKGFTLMELLAVIVILAVIALITIPIVSNVIKTSKKNAFKLSVGQVSDNIYFHYTKDWLLEGMTEDKVFNFDTNENIDLLNLSGKLPSSGTISINPQGKITINVNDGVYCAVKTIDQSDIQVGEIVNGTCEITGEAVDACVAMTGRIWNFDYISTGEDRSQQFIAPCEGKYKLEVWGAQGGSNNEEYFGGYGGYSTGSIHLNENAALYINVGGQGAEFDGGYNGGGLRTNSNWGWNGRTGGGATHIALDTGLLSTFATKQDRLIIVAGGGGGSSMGNDYNSSGSHAGGFKANDAYCAKGGSQTSGGSNCNGGVAGSFGQGSSAGDNVGTGGGGFFGGGSGNASAAYSGAGGSGYIGNYLLTDKFMYCYQCSPSNDEDTLTRTGEDVSDKASSSHAKKENGYARITYLGNDRIICNSKIGDVWVFNYKEENNNGVYQTFDTPCNGVYKIELWGASGGYGTTNNTGGKGGYTSGNIDLLSTEDLFVYVGGQGTTNTVSVASNVDISSTRFDPAPGGWNGGGTSGNQSIYNGSGGGATDIRLKNGEWNNFASLKSRIMVAAGGGGGAYYETNGSHYGNGGDGGGLNGINGTGPNVNYQRYGGGATQTGVSYNKGEVAPGFGYGGYTNTSFRVTGGGGSGYYGGAAGGDYGAGGGGGSSFISGYAGCNALSFAATSSNLVYTSQPNHYSGKVFTNSLMKAGNEEMPTHDGTGTMTGNIGNGYARITLLEIK